MTNNGIWIRIQFNQYNQYEGSEELISELKEICPVQSSTRWYPAACTGLELLLSLNFNLSLSAFLNNVLIPGAEFAGFWTGAKYVWKCFSKFYDRNQAVEIEKLDITFDDVTIEIENVMSYGALLKLYNEFPKHLRHLKNEGINNICKIKLPYVERKDEETGQAIFRESALEDDEPIFWEIIYEWGCEKCFYNPQVMAIVPLW